MGNVEIPGAGQMNLHERLKAIRMSGSDRQQAVAALRNAEIACELLACAAGWFGALKAALMGSIRRRLAQP